MRHGRRTTITTSDIDQALRVLNIEPLYGHSASNPPVFRKAPPFASAANAGTVYFVEDEEIDFDRVLPEEKITLPKGVSWTAHWLAVEGVQPLIPENPPAISKDAPPSESPAKPTATTIPGFPPTPPSSDRSTASNDRQQQISQQQQQLVKQVLSRELQLYYTRLTSALIPPSSTDQTKRTAALASLRHDAGLQALLPYIVKWVAEGVISALKEGSQSETDGRTLDTFLDVISAVLDNQTLFAEPYVRYPFYKSTLLILVLPSFFQSSTKSFLRSFQSSSIHRYRRHTRITCALPPLAHSPDC
jgi:transcription initiation factor TFIID subunit 6